MSRLICTVRSQDGAPPSPPMSTRRFTSEVIRTLLPQQMVFGGPPAFTRLRTLEQALDLIEQHPNTALDSTLTVAVQPAAPDQPPVLHTLLSAALHACNTLQPISAEAANRLLLDRMQPGPHPGPPDAGGPGRPPVNTMRWLGATILRVIGHAVEPSSKTTNCPLGRHRLQTALFKAMRERDLSMRHDSGNASSLRLVPEADRFVAPSLPANAVKAPPLLILALHAFIPGAPTLTELLDHHGCDANEFDEDGHAPLHFLLPRMLSSETRLGFAQRLVAGAAGTDRAVDINLKTRDASRHTALHMAAREKDAELFIFLLKCGADPSIRNRHGSNAFYSLATNVYSFAPYRPGRLEQVLRFLLDLLASQTEVGSEAEQRKNNVANALFDCVEPPGFPRDDTIAQSEASSNQLPDASTSTSHSPSSVSSSSSSSNLSPVAAVAMLPTPPGLLLYARAHIYELLDDRLNSMLREIAQSPQPVFGPGAARFRRKPALESIMPHAFKRGVAAVMKPVLMRELDDFLIPDLAAIVVGYLL